MRLLSSLGLLLALALGGPAMADFRLNAESALMGDALLVGAGLGLSGSNELFQVGGEIRVLRGFADSDVDYLLSLFLTLDAVLDFGELVLSPGLAVGRSVCSQRGPLYTQSTTGDTRHSQWGGTATESNLRLAVDWRVRHPLKLGFHVGLGGFSKWINNHSEGEPMAPPARWVLLLGVGARLAF
jgi:hypothetical protein